MYIHQEAVLSRGTMIDVEGAGPTPEGSALLSIGGCVIGDTSQRFYVELKPDSMEYDPEALAVCGFDLQYQRRVGIDPKIALQAFVQWVCSQRSTPLFVAHNAPFDWMFVQTYLDRYEVQNPFGHWAFDTLSAYGSIMTSHTPHHAGEDAYIQTLDLLRFFEEGVA